MDELLRNGSGYVDWTAYKAMKSTEKGQDQMTCNHGDICEYELKGSYEIKTALVVSADWRANDRFVNVIVLTEEPKGQISVPITTKSGVMYADCGMTSFAETSRISCFIQAAKASEMKQVEEGIIECLGFGGQVIEKEVVKEVIKEVPKEVILPLEHTDLTVDLSMDLAAAKKEAEIFKSLYEQLLEKMLKG